MFVRSQFHKTLSTLLITSVYNCATDQVLGFRCEGSGVVRVAQKQGVQRKGGGGQQGEQARVGGEDGELGRQGHQSQLWTTPPTNAGIMRVINARKKAG